MPSKKAEPEPGFGYAWVWNNNTIDMLHVEGFRFTRRMFHGQGKIVRVAVAPQAHYGHLLKLKRLCKELVEERKTWRPLGSGHKRILKIVDTIAAELEGE